MYPDFKELLSTFNAHKVEYLIVGGYAVGFHAQPRATKDLDIFIRPDAENARAIYNALAKFGAPLEGVTPEDFLDRDGFFRMGHAPVMIEVLPSITGVEFDDAWSKRLEIEVDAETGLKAFTPKTSPTWTLSGRRNKARHHPQRKERSTSPNIEDCSFLRPPSTHGLPAIYLSPQQVTLWEAVF